MRKPNNTNKQFRHGDVFVTTINEIPAEALLMPDKKILAFGEVTGHHHKVECFDPTKKYMISVSSPAGPVQSFLTGAELAEMQEFSYEMPEKMEAPLIYEKDGNLYMKCTTPVALTHQEHSTLLIPPGIYGSRIQVEYQPKAAPRRVAD